MLITRIVFQSFAHDAKYQTKFGHASYSALYETAGILLIMQVGLGVNTMSVLFLLLMSSLKFCVFVMLCFCPLFLLVF